MPLHDEWQVRRRPDEPYRLVIANGPPDTETIDRRRVDPPAGCRAAAEPAHLTVRRSVDDPLVDQPTGRVAPLVPQEALDVRDQVVARRQTLLVVHSLQPFDVATGRFVQPCSCI